VVRLGLGRTTVEEWVGQVTADAGGSFITAFVVGVRWQSAGQLTLTALVPGGRTATTPLWVAAPGGRVVPGGANLIVTTYRWKDNPDYVKVTAENWPPGRNVDVYMISADGTLNLRVAGGMVKEDGMLQAGFDADAAWWGRADLGVRVSTSDGTAQAIRYLPLTAMVKQRDNSYDTRGVNWPAGTPIQVVLHLAGADEEVLGTATTDSSGTFQLNVTLPRIPPENQNDIEIRAVNSPYQEIIDF
jgi:hypothetical protein